MVELESSNIASAGCDLIVSFKNGTTYRYKDVEPEVIDGFFAAESHGKFLNAVIKPNFAVEQLS